MPNHYLLSTASGHCFVGATVFDTPAKAAVALVDAAEGRPLSWMGLTGFVQMCGDTYVNTPERVGPSVFRKCNGQVVKAIGPTCQ